MGPRLTCDGCGTAEHLKIYQFDIDLPTINACKLCIMFLADPNMADQPGKDPAEPANKGGPYEDETGEFRLEAQNGKTVADSGRAVETRITRSTWFRS